jgi:hypothetical protein
VSCRYIITKLNLLQPENPSITDNLCTAGHYKTVRLLPSWRHKVKNSHATSSHATYSFARCYMCMLLGVTSHWTHLRESLMCRTDHFGYVPLEITFLCCNFLFPSQLNVWRSFIEVRNFSAWKLKDRTSEELSRSDLFYFSHPGPSQCLIT